jgi:hypothetical protein
MLAFTWEDGYKQFVLKKVQLADGTAITYDGDAQEEDKDSGEEEEEDEEEHGGEDDAEDEDEEDC